MAADYQSCRKSVLKAKRFLATALSPCHLQPPAYVPPLSVRCNLVIDAWHHSGKGDNYEHI